MTIADSIRGKLEKAFAPTVLTLENESHSHAVPANSETHFKLILVSPAFEGKSRLDRQRMVTDLLEDERRRGLHALTQRVLTPVEWEQVKDGFELVSPACHGGGKRN